MTLWMRSGKNGGLAKKGKGKGSDENKESVREKGSAGGKAACSFYEEHIGLFDMGLV